MKKVLFALLLTVGAFASVTEAYMSRGGCGQKAAACCDQPKPCCSRTETRTRMIPETYEVTVPVEPMMKVNTYKTYECPCNADMAR